MILIAIITLVIAAIMRLAGSNGNSNAVAVPAAVSQPENTAPQQIVGGPCDYQSVPGTCHISSITPDGTVNFTYAPTGQLPDTPLAENLNGERSDTMNIFNPDDLPAKAGDTVACEAQLETKGTCTPVIFRLVAPPVQNSAGNASASADGLHMYQNDRLSFQLEIPNYVQPVENNNVVWLGVKEAFGVTYPDYEKTFQKITGSGTAYEKASGIPWAILVGKVSNDKELESLIQQRYGKTCKLGEKTPGEQAGSYDLQIKSTGPDGGCFINYAVAIKYDPDKKIAAIWDIGQAPTFISSSDEVFDPIMSASFRFID